MEVAVPQGQGSLQVVFLASGEPNPFALANDPNLTQVVFLASGEPNPFALANDPNLTQVVFLASGEPFALADDPNLTPAMEVDVSQGQSPLQIIVLAPDEPNPFAVADNPDVSPVWVSMQEYLPWVSTTPDTDGHRSSKRARVAAASEAILPEVSDRSREGEECAICLQEFAAEETLRAIPCSHAFHRHCISKWLCHKATCPLCRHQLPATPEPEEDDDAIE